MLLNFKVKNFRSIKEEIILDLQATKDDQMKSEAVIDQGKVSLLKSVAIYGPNASGKSNILKAYMVFRTMVLESALRSTMPIDLPNEFFKLSTDTINQPSGFEITFLLDGDIFQYGFEINKKRVVSEHLMQNARKLIERNEKEIIGNKNYFKEATLESRLHTPDNVLFLSKMAGDNGLISRKIVHFIQNTNFISGTERNDTLDYAFGMYLTNPIMADKMKDFTIKADFGVTGIKASEEMVLAKEVANIPDKFKEMFFKEDSQIAQRSISFLHKQFNEKGKRVSDEALDFLSEESEGTQQFFALSAPILDTLDNGKILFIDEIDASLHPVLCQYLVSLFNSKKKNPNHAQLIFSTHDISLLNEDYLRRDEIYFTEKNERGATELFSLSDISERKGVNFAKRYLEGRYNALPYIPEYEDLKFSK